MSEEILDEINRQLYRIADALEKFVENYELKQVLIKEQSQFTQDNLVVEEEVIMDFKDVTILVITDRALLVTKKGYQKWIPKSAIKDFRMRNEVFDVLELEHLHEGTFLEDIYLTPQAEKWIPKKSWDKLEVRKR